MRDAKRRGFHSNDAFETFKIAKEKTTKIALSFGELEKLFSLDLSGNQRLERVRDLFLIGAFSGLRFSDFSRLRPEHIAKVEGEKMIAITTQKTGEQVFIPLFPILEILLEKYDFAVPTISGQKMNDYLKELGQVIPSPSSHTRTKPHSSVKSLTASSNAFGIALKVTVNV